MNDELGALDTMRSGAIEWLLKRFSYGIQPNQGMCGQSNRGVGAALCARKLATGLRATVAADGVRARRVRLENVSWSEEIDDDSVASVGHTGCVWGQEDPEVVGHAALER